MRINKPNIISLLSIALIIMGISNCSPKLTIPQPVNVTSQPGINFSQNNKIAVIIDFSKIDLQNQDPLLAFITEDELRKRKFDVVSHNEFISYITRNQIKNENLYQPESLSKVAKYFGISAVLQGTMEKLNRNLTEETPIFMDTSKRAPNYYIPAGNVASVTRNLVDMDLKLELIDTRQGKKIWSCSISCERLNASKIWYLVFRQMIQNSLNTIPLQ